MNNILNLQKITYISKKEEIKNATLTITITTFMSTFSSFC